MVTVTLDGEGMVQRLEALSKQVSSPAGLSMAIGRGVRRLVRDHFIALDRSRANSLSDRRTHFYRNAADSTNVPVVSPDGGTVTVSITKTGISQRLFGGTIRAKRSKFLTIPVSPDAYGRTASQFEAETGLTLILLRTGGTASNRLSHAVLATRRGTGFQVEYVLKSQVEQKADPTVIPPEEKLEAEALRVAESYVARQVARAEAAKNSQS